MEAIMNKLEGIVGGTINGYGGIDVGYQPTRFSVGSGGQIMEGYQDTFARIGQDGNIRGSYGELTGLSVSQWSTIGNGY